MRTPGIKVNYVDVNEEDDDPLGDNEKSKYRGIVARANYLQQDRSDIQYAVKELCRGMSCPTREDERKMKRMARYLKGKPRVVNLFKYQSGKVNVEVHVDTDYAGCRRTRKSTSGGTACLGEHLVKSWSATQAVIALSSGEAEYYGIVKGSSVALGIQSVVNDLGMGTKVKIHTDASAAKGIASRRGLGKVRHIEVNQLWVQEKVAKGEIDLIKIPGTENRADALTKYVEGDKL